MAKDYPFSLASEPCKAFGGLLRDDFPTVKTSKGIEYVNVPCSFDIETTSFKVGEDKRACMYAYVLGINGNFIFGRTWRGFVNRLRAISKRLHLDPKSRLLIIYVHNLSFEFQFMRKWLKWENVFARAEREPLKALTSFGIEFRDSYALSGYSLAETANHLHKYDVEKLVGDLDYSLARHPKTPLTDKEWAYLRNDGLVVMAYIKEEMEAVGNDISRVQLTKTGKVRKLVRDNCYQLHKHHRGNRRKYSDYRLRMLNLQISDVDEYLELKRAFQGGFTHASSFYSGVTQSDVTSFDITSSYPSAMVMNEFPIATGERVKPSSKEEFENYIHKYCCVFDVTFHNLREKLPFDHPLSHSKCWGISDDFEVDNGRIIRASWATTTLTEVDLGIMRDFYSWDKMEVSNMIAYRKGLLPKDFVLSILTLYKDKTSLKGVEGKELEYSHAKEYLNSTYGMCVTDILGCAYSYKDGNWVLEEKDMEEALRKYNESKTRFLAYQWGVWITAYARRRLFQLMKRVGWDYLYCDTDSVKMLHGERHRKDIDELNAIVMKRTLDALSRQGIDPTLADPVTIKGDHRFIGLWDFDGHYDRFKTLGAKRYLIESEGKLSMTVSGISKRKGAPWLLDEAKRKGKDPFDIFADGLLVPYEGTGKLTHAYVDEGKRGCIRDYLGNVGKYDERSCINLEGATYELSILPDYLALLDLRHNYIIGG